VTDGKSAIRWIKSHAGELGVDPEKIVGGGGSAGGHICVLAALNADGLNDPADPVGIDTSVRAFLLFNPAFVTPGSDRDAEVDVFEHLDGNLPPFLFLFGTEDTWKPATDVLFETLKKKQSATRYLVAPEEGHSFWIKDPWYDLCLAECDALLVSLGLLEGPAPVPAPSDKRLVHVK
jgi:acetyl esterase/lipase